MKKTQLAYTLALFAATSCSANAVIDEDEAVAVTQEALDVTAPSLLTRKQSTQLAADTDEADRQDDTQLYYDHIQIGADGETGGTVNQNLNTLSKFITRYGFVGHEHVANYYNRGDLGIGREMHCVDNLGSTGEAACYVRNFAAGTDGTEFIFGMSQNIAFANMDANHPFATVAMVYRSEAPTSGNNLFFVVYNGAGNLQEFAALDRVGLLAANAFAAGQPFAGVAGQDYNNHIPSNCASCHGGLKYQAPLQRGSLFLPFDLDNFEYEGTGARSRSVQLTEFKHLNEIVWKVATISVNDAVNHSVSNQLDGWYNNTIYQASHTNEVFENDFNSSYVPTGWSGFSGLYSSVVRPSCRGCHLTNDQIPFDDETNFRGVIASLGVPDLCSFQMPHSLQSMREFWLSARPAQLEAYLRSIGQTAAADQLHSCGPGNVVTLDPQEISRVVLASLL
jgi:hypothetical protein